MRGKVKLSPSQPVPNAKLLAISLAESPVRPFRDTQRYGRPGYNPDAH
jgi:hypothetical protein